MLILEVDGLCWVCDSVAIKVDFHCSKCMFSSSLTHQFYWSVLRPCRDFMVLFSQMLLLYQCILHQKQNRVMWIHLFSAEIQQHIVLTTGVIYWSLLTQRVQFSEKKSVVILIVYMNKKMMFYSRYKTIYLWF